MEFFDLFREGRWPHMFCPGCGNGTVMNCFHRAFSELSMDQDRTVFVSGIGCASRVIGYIRADSIHTTHGRALAVATGIKLANPDLNVIVFSGDGDIGAIGGNHFINAARRNVDISVFCINNYIYGMTGGQAFSTSPYKSYSSTTPYGSKEYPFDLAEVAVASGANYVAGSHEVPWSHHLGIRSGVSRQTPLVPHCRMSVGLTNEPSFVAGFG